jgi:hypothetical protein
MVDSNNGNDDKSKGKESDTNKGKAHDAVGKLSDGLLRLVEEDDGKGNISYCVETVDGDELVYSSVSKAQAFSFCEGYREAEGKGTAKVRKPKADDATDDRSDDESGSNPPVVDPAKIKRERKLI